MPTIATNFLFHGITGMSLLVGIRSRFRRITWTFCRWWSGFWSIMFNLVVAIPPLGLGKEAASALADYIRGL